MHKIYSDSTKKPLGRLLEIVTKVYGWYLKNAFVTYQPVIVGSKLYGGVRPTIDRWGLIKKEIEPKSSVLDIGCAEGLFTLLTARDLHCVSLGVDIDRRRLAFAQYQLLSQSVENAGFIYAECTIEFISKLPKFDYVIFLSIFHHLTARYGIDYSKEFLTEVRRHTKKAMFFETGLSREETRTTKKIPDMGKDYKTWLTELILSTGWSRIETLGESPSYARDASRPILKVCP